MSYFGMVIKRALKAGTAFRAVVLCLLLTGIMYDMNLQYNSTDSFRCLCEQNLSFYEGMAAGMNASEDTINGLYAKNVRTFTSILDSLDREDYAGANASYSGFVMLNLEMMEAAGIYSESEKLLQDYEFYDFLARENLEKDAEIYPVFGATFFLQCWRDLFPYLIALVLCYGLSGVFVLQYRDGIDTDRVSPANPLYRETVSVSAGILYGTVLAAVLQAAPLLLGTLFSKAGSLRYPLLCYGENGPVYRYAYTLLPQTFLLMVLCIIAVSLFVRILSFLFRRGMPVFLVSTVAAGGYVYLAGAVEPLQRSCHLVPMTYLNCLKVVSGQLAWQYGNPAITFAMGVRVLLWTILFEMVIVFLHAGWNR